MGAKYTTQSASGYNASPPSDDGSQTTTNKVTWAMVKTKLADTIKALADAINSQLVTALDTSSSAKSSAYSTVAGDNLKPIQVTGTTTITLGDAATMGVGYQVPIVNAGTGVVTVNLTTAADTLNGIANGTLIMAPFSAMTFFVLSTANGYRVMNTAAQQPTAPNTQTGATYTVSTSDTTIIANRAGTVTLTLLAAATYPGRRLRAVTIQAQTVVSASSNVVPLAGGSAGTAILAATAGKWADLESDGTNWIITASN